MLAHSVDRAGMQAQFLTAASRQFINFESAEPRGDESAGYLFPVVIVNPNEIPSLTLLAERPVCNFTL
jgi:hypothetical protein